MFLQWMAGWNISTGKTTFSMDSFKSGCEGFGMVLNKVFTNLNEAKVAAFRQLERDLNRYYQYIPDNEKAIFDRLRRQLELQINQLELFE